MVASVHNAPHTDAARLRIAAGVRAHHQRKRERASLIVYAIDTAFEAIERFEAVGAGTDEAEAERLFAAAVEAIRTARDLSRPTDEGAAR